MGRRWAQKGVLCFTTVPELVEGTHLWGFEVDAELVGDPLDDDGGAVRSCQASDPGPPAPCGRDGTSWSGFLQRHRHGGRFVDESWTSWEVRV